MILFGAGSSVPFDIPGMTEFTEQFIAKNQEMSDFIMNIKDSINKSEEMIGISLSFDLETLLSVLTDLAGAINGKTISIPTASLLLKQSLNIKTAREKYGNEATLVLDKLREFIFETCMQPIKKGKKEGNFSFLDRFYGPLMTVLNYGDPKNIQNIQHPLRRIYSTNWDLCFKTWVDYVNIPINDGTYMDRQSLPVLNVGKFSDTSDGFNYVPLHGSLDFIKISRPKGKGTYKDIFKISDLIGYFDGQLANMKNVFIIYPLEAIGYEESVKSPYLDMLNTFRYSLRQENVIFIIGYSLRDPTIGSIFEEVIAERIRNRDLNLLSDDINSRKNEVSNHKLKIVVINPDPDKLVTTLKKQSHTNLLQTFVPIKIRFPKIADKDFEEQYTRTLSQLIKDLIQIGYIDSNQENAITNVLENQYGIHISKETSWVTE